MPLHAQQLLGLLVLVGTAFAIARRLEVRLTLLLAGLLLGALAWDVRPVVRTFFATFADEKFVVPICTAMGFAHVLRHTGCDRDLVHLLVRPLTRLRPLLVPGTVVVGFLVNLPIVSQTSTAATIGPVLVPILLAARVRPATIGAALLLGSSIGGELLNPGAPELRTVVAESQRAAGEQKESSLESERFDFDRCVARVLPLNLLGLLVATLVFWGQSYREERQAEQDTHAEPNRADAPTYRVHLLRAAVPLVPLVVLYLTALPPPFRLVEVPYTLLEAPNTLGEPSARFETRLIGAAMLLGATVAALAVPSKALGAPQAFCEGAGFAFGHIISLIVAANCFGRGIAGLGFAATLGGLIRTWPGLLLPVAGLAALGFALLSGSGMATTQSLFGLFAGPALEVGVDPTHVGAVVALAGAAGRSSSPVAAVALLCATLCGASPLALVRRTIVPALAAVVAIVIAAVLLAPPP